MRLGVEAFAKTEIFMDAGLRMRSSAKPFESLFWETGFYMRLNVKPFAQQILETGVEMRLNVKHVFKTGFGNVFFNMFEC